MKNYTAFKFTPDGIGSVLKLNRLKVPKNQREYAWADEQVDQLYKDFQKAKNDHANYFLGTIVTVASESDDLLEIVDGQQRLTTTAILIAAIRDYLEANSSENLMVESINTEILSTIDRRASERVPRLSLNIDDNDFFRSLINRDDKSSFPKPTRSSHELMVQAYKIASSFVVNITKPFDLKDVPEVLEDWLEFIEKSATVIMVEAPDTTQAFKMFETLNDRGLKTTQADLVKNYLLSEAGSRIDEAQTRWSSMRDNLEEIDDDDSAVNFLRHLLIATKIFVRADDVFEQIQKSIRGESNTNSFLRELEDASRIYVATFSAGSDFWNGYSIKSVKALKIFNMFNIKPMRPLLLAIALNFKGIEFEKSLKILVNISVRMLIALNSRSGAIEQTLASAAVNISTGDIKNAKELKGSLAKIIATDKEFQNAFLTAKSAKAEYARYYLRSLEAAAEDDNEPYLIPNDDQTEITLEHILPKKIDYSQNQWNGFSKEEHQAYHKRIGNLCLLQKSANSDLKSGSFSSKLDSYKKSPYTLTSGLSEYEQWNPNSVEERQKLLSSLAVKAWSI